LLKDINGCGLGLRSEFIDDLDKSNDKPTWLEIVPENWIHMPKKFEKVF